MASDRIEKIFEKIKANKKLQIILVVFLFVAVLLILIFPKFESTSIDSIDSVSVYVQELEDKLSRTLSKVDGVGKVEVIIKIESGMQTVLANKTTITESNGVIEKVETPIIVNGKTVVIAENYPEISGVLIVCEGANSIAVKSKILNATVSLLDIDLGQIEILKMA